MPILYHPISLNSKGGTELLCKRLENDIPEEILDKVQIIPSRLESKELLDMTKHRIAYMHDLPGDPASDYMFKNEGWRDYHKLVFTSNWQMQSYIEFYKIPWSHCVVIRNSIEPINSDDNYTKYRLDQETFPMDMFNSKIRVIYTPTPHRGLDVLLAAWDMLLKHDNTFADKVHLDVYSSFALYGWDDRNEQFKPLFDWMDEQPSITRHGTVSNEELRYALLSSDIFAYPSTYPETSCLCLIEAMSAGLVCVHSNLAGLYETSAALTQMYQFHENKEVHTKQFAAYLYNVISNIDEFKSTTQSQKQYVDVIHNWNNVKVQWEILLSTITQLPLEPIKPAFVYRTS